VLLGLYVLKSVRAYRASSSYGSDKVLAFTIFRSAGVSFASGAQSFSVLINRYRRTTMALAAVQNVVANAWVAPLERRGGKVRGVLGQDRDDDRDSGYPHCLPALECSSADGVALCWHWRGMNTGTRRAELAIISAIVLLAIAIRLPVLIGDGLWRDEADVYLRLTRSSFDVRAACALYAREVFRLANHLPN
jgi:hypothetical protein